MGRKRKTMEKKGKKHHPEARLRVRDNLRAGEDDLGTGCQKALLLSLSQYASVRVEAVQPTACFFADFFAIWV
jgi:hypothetical protein